MPDHDQVVRFAVGSASGPRSRTWRLWVPKRKSDVYVASRRLGNSVKVSLHKLGPARFALTSEFIRESGFQAPEGRDPRLAFEWERPRPRPPDKFARPFAILVPWDEVVDRDTREAGDVVWIEPPLEGSYVHFDVVYSPSGVTVTGHPGARSQGTKLVGRVELANGEGVFITGVVREMEAELREQIAWLRSGRVRDAKGKPVENIGLLAFGTQPNPDADDGTSIGIFTDVTLPG
jgi:hypothetical protein